MTTNQEQPRFVDPALRSGSASLASEPPFVFRDVNVRVFPVKANPARLYDFCDHYLNMDIPRRIAHFRPSIPYVYVMVLNYGRMALESITAQNLGWVSQHEVTFTVPLTWWREEDGRLRFKNWAFVSPFIFVDNELSQTTGREVYGWPKVAAHVASEIPLWTQHPRAATRLFSLCTQVFPKIYAGQRQQRRVLMQIDRDPAPDYAEFPPDRTGAWSPLRILPAAANATIGLMGDALDMLGGLRLRGYRRSPASMLDLLGSSSRGLARLLPRLLLPPGEGQGGNPRVAAPDIQVEQITLKQFRDPERPHSACYQALIASGMGLDRFNRGGLLGNVNLLRGDPSGGFSLRVHRYPGQPIVESLGLQVARVEEGEEVPIDVLKPTLPFWNDVDLCYGAGRVICSRTPGNAEVAADAWRDAQSEPATRPGVMGKGRLTGPKATQSEPGSAGSPRQTPAPAAKACQCEIPYNTARGAATQPISGPFHFPDLTLQVYPLLAERERLEAMLTRYLNEPIAGTGHRFEPAGSYVYLTVTLFGEQLGSMWSEANNIGWWADKEVAFCVPVKWLHNGELVSLGLVSPFVFANSGRAAITDREVNGRPTVNASIEAQPDQWLSDSGPAADRRLLRVATEVFPALHLGQEARERTLIEIDQRDSLDYGDDVGWRLIAERWGKTLVAELKRKRGIGVDQADEIRQAKALALQILAREVPINWFTFKQYRDAGATDRACYQAVVHTQRTITATYDLREIEDRVHVRLHRYPGQPIADSLGLLARHTESRAGAVVQELQPFRPFWMRLAMAEELGRVLCWRAGDSGWHLTHPWFSGHPDSTPVSDTGPGLRGDGLTAVGAELGDPRPSWQRLKLQTAQWLREQLCNETDATSAALRALTDQERRALEDRLSATLGQGKAKRYLAQLIAAAAPREFAAAVPIDDLLPLVDACRDVLGEVSREANGSARLSRSQARRALTGLDDLQIVIETILSEEWEHWGDSRRSRDRRPKPAVCVRADSLGSAGQPFQELHPDLASFEERWWYID